MHIVLSLCLGAGLYLLAGALTGSARGRRGAPGPPGQAGGRPGDPSRGAGNWLLGRLPRSGPGGAGLRELSAAGRGRGPGVGASRAAALRLAGRDARRRLSRGAGAPSGTSGSGRRGAAPRSPRRSARRWRRCATRCASASASRSRCAPWRGRVPSRSAPCSRRWSATSGSPASRRPWSAPASASPSPSSTRSRSRSSPPTASAGRNLAQVLDGISASVRGERAGAPRGELPAGAETCCRRG